MILLHTFLKLCIFHGLQLKNAHLNRLLLAANVENYKHGDHPAAAKETGEDQSYYKLTIVLSRSPLSISARVTIATVADVQPALIVTLTFIAFTFAESF